MTTPDTAEAVVWNTVRHTHTRVARQLSSDLDSSCAISLTTFEILDHLHREPGTRINDLLEVVPLTQATLSRTIDKLQDQELLKRQPDPQDRRATVLTLTSRGRDTLARATPVHAAGIREYLPVHLTPQRLAALHPLYQAKLAERDGTS